MLYQSFLGRGDLFGSEPVRDAVATAATLDCNRDAPSTHHQQRARASWSRKWIPID